MKKINLLFIAFIFGIIAVKANPVNANAALKVAENFYATIHSNSSTNFTLAYTERDASGEPVYYVFNIGDASKGFVIVTADDAARPIIGYSDEGSFVVPTSNNNVSFWLQKRKNEVTAIRKHNIAPTSNITNEWTSYISGYVHTTHSVASSSVLPLCRTYWNQEPYYNAYCPGGSVTGCVATAMAQILKYWEYPGVGNGSNCYDDSRSHGYSENYGELCATFDTSHYKWSAMQNTPLGDSNNQIAKLMYDCGVSVDMDYTPTGSGAQVIGYGPSAYNSYTAYFGYDASTINAAMYNGNDASWISLLESELNSGRPMQFEGTDPNEGGHSWVCDGYSTLNMMHMNWGWGGINDGYYSVDSLNPTGFDFNEYIGIIYGIQPPPGALGVNQISDNTEINVYPNPSHGVFNFVMPNNNTAYQLRVYNVLGQEVTTSIINSGKGVVDLSSQSKGVYIYKVLSETGTPISTGRLVVE